MPCDTVVQKGQTLSERKAELRKKAEQIARQLVNGSVKAKVGPQGAIAFLGITDRGGMTDACIYRRIMAGNSALAKQAIVKAEMLAGRSVNKQMVAAGVHSHDGGQTWHNKG